MKGKARKRASQSPAGRGWTAYAMWTDPKFPPWYLENVGFARRNDEADPVAPPITIRSTKYSLTALGRSTSPSNRLPTGSNSLEKANG